MNWYNDELRDLKSLGQTAAKASCLGELHDRRDVTMGQFFTPLAIASLMWSLAEPAMARARMLDPQRLISLMDNSIGSGRLLHLADPTMHSIAGVDVHGPSVERFMRAAQQAGFLCDIHTAAMENTSFKRFDVGLINPPFSLTLASPHMEPLPGTAFGRFGPHTSALSHAYALEQALAAARVVIALLPRSYAQEILAKGHPRLAAALHLPGDAFAEQEARVSTSILAFDSEPRATAPRIERWTSGSNPFDPGLTIGARHAKPARVCVRDADDEGPAIKTPVTFGKRVRVVRNGRRLVLKFDCGLMEAKCLNRILIERVNPGVKFRYPVDVKYVGQAAFDVETLLTHSNPIYAFRRYIVNAIEEAGGWCSVDPGVVPYLKRRANRLARQTIPFRRVAYVQLNGGTHGLPEQGSFEVESRSLQQLAPSEWGSPVLEAGARLPAVVERSTKGLCYRIGSGKHHVTLTAEELAARFKSHGGKAPEGGWRCVELGRFGRFAEHEQLLRHRAKAMGLDRWLTWSYQFDDLIEMALGRGNAVGSHEMGLGKSRLAAALCMIGGGKHSLLVSESHLVFELVGELRKLGVDQALWKVIDSPEDLKNLARVNLISYSRLRRPVDERRPKRTYAKALRNRIHTLVGDEIHAAANNSTQQTRALWAVNARVRYGCSGTPISNYPRNLLPILQYIAGDASALQPYGNRRPLCRVENLKTMDFCPRGIDAFAERHVTLTWVTNRFREDLEQGAKREIPRIRDVPGYRSWIAPMIKRRLRAEPECAEHVKVQVPTRSVHTVPWDRPHLAYYLAVSDAFSRWYKEARRDAEVRGVRLNLVLLLRRIQEVFFAMSHPQRVREDVQACYRGGLTSLQRFAIEHLAKVAEGGERALCFAQSPRLLELLGRELRERGIEVSVLHGGIPPRERMWRLDREFRNGSAQHLLLSFDANKAGLNVPQASRVLLYDRSWSSKTEEQAIGRCLRPEQTRAVHVDYVHLEGSLAVYQAQVVNAKLDAIAAGLDWGEQQEDTPFLHMDQIFETFVEDLAGKFGKKRHELREELRHVA